MDLFYWWKSNARASREWLQTGLKQLWLTVVVVRMAQRLGQKHRAKLACPDHSDTDRVPVFGALEKFGKQVHGSGPGKLRSRNPRQLEARHVLNHAKHLSAIAVLVIIPNIKHQPVTIDDGRQCVHHTDVRCPQ